MDADTKVRLYRNFWDVATKTERYALLNGTLGVGANFYELSKKPWDALSIQIRAELLVLDWEGMLGRRIPGFEFQ